jgi:hypothetical protein
MDQSPPSLTQINAGKTAPRQFHGPCRDSAMNEQFQALPMTWASARAAYPLVYLHDASVTLEKWLHFVRRRCRATSGRSGLMAIRDCRGIVHALFSYRVDFDLRTRKRLCIANLIVAHLPGSQIDHAVVASTGQVAASLGCQTISIEQPFPGLGIASQCPTAQFLRMSPPLISTRQH